MGSVPAHLVDDEPVDDAGCGLVRRFQISADMNIGRLRGFAGAIEAGGILDLAGVGL